ncbi:MAG: hypothetical protein KC910_03855 [Candidatus Eremiobacteraeota bacterium]|nr:hypothetical protein [Candidatus Eremiobacteraeota bacterium]
MKVDRHELKGNPQQLLSMLAEAAVADKQAEKQKWLGGGLLGCGCLGMFFLWPLVVGSLAALFSLQLNSATAGGILVSAVLIAALIGGFRIYKKASEYDLDDQRLALVQAVLRHLALDLPPSKELELVVDFRQADTTPFLQTGDTNTGSFCQPWLQLRGRFLDGTAFSIGIEQLVKKKTKYKRKGNRIKRKVGERLIIDLKTSPSAYPDLANINEFLGSPPARLRAASVKAVGQRVKAVLMTERAMPYVDPASVGVSQADTLLEGLVFVYRGLRRLKANGIQA